MMTCADTIYYICYPCAM